MAAAEWEALIPAYEAMLEARGNFTKAYEDAQEAGVVSEKTTQAVRAELTLAPEAFALLTGADAPDLAEAFVCAEVAIAEGDELACVVAPASGEKCPRCWNWRALGEDGVCPRCAAAVEEWKLGHAEEA